MKIFKNQKSQAVRRMIGEPGEQGPTWLTGDKWSSTGSRTVANDAMFSPTYLDYDDHRIYETITLPGLSPGQRHENAANAPNTMISLLFLVRLAAPALLH